MEKISGVYKITNTVTNDFYIGSSNNVKRRWAEHRHISVWKKHPNNPMYQDMKRHGLDYFVFEILAEVEPDKLKEAEQQFIEMLKPTYNNYNAKGLDVERLKKYYKSDKYKESKNEYYKSDKCKKRQNKYDNQLCSYNSEVLTLCALSTRFRRAGVEHPTLEAKKYIIKN